MFVFVCVYVVTFILDVADLWMHQPGSHRRKITQDSSVFFLEEIGNIFKDGSGIYPRFVSVFLKHEEK